MNTIVMTAGVIAAIALMPAHAEPTITCPKGEKCGVSRTVIEYTELSEKDLKGVRYMATVNVMASAQNVSMKVNQQGMAKAVYTACFETFLTTEGDYKFTLDVGGLQTVVGDHIVLPARQRTCVSKELYKPVSFPSTGNYQYTATSTGYTMSSGNHSTNSVAYIMVR